MNELQDLHLRPTRCQRARYDIVLIHLCNCIQDIQVALIFKIWFARVFLQDWGAERAVVIVTMLLRQWKDCCSVFGFVHCRRAKEPSWSQLLQEFAGIRKSGHSPDSIWEFIALPRGPSLKSRIGSTGTQVAQVNFESDFKWSAWYDKYCDQYLCQQ